MILNKYEVITNILYEYSDEPTIYLPLSGKELLDISAKSAIAYFIDMIEIRDENLKKEFNEFDKTLYSNDEFEIDIFEDFIENKEDKYIKVDLVYQVPTNEDRISIYFKINKDYPNLTQEQFMNYIIAECNN